MNTIGNQNLLIKVNILERRINTLESKIDKILYILEENGKDCKKMSSHIDFVDGVYENIRAPINYVCDTINNKYIEHK